MLVMFCEKKTKKISFVVKLIKVSIVETQLNPTKKTRRNVSKRFLKKIQKIPLRNLPKSQDIQSKSEGTYKKNPSPKSK